MMPKASFANSNGPPCSESLVSPAISLTLKVAYKTDIGQSLCVVGNILALGKWESFNAHMKWTEGDIWVLQDLPIEVDRFEYKYVVMDNKTSPLKWEKGHNRICDLNLLESQQKSKSITLTDMFDKYSVNFNMHHPLKNNEFMRINGDTSQLGDWGIGRGCLSM